MKKITRLFAFRAMRWKITNPKTLLYLNTALVLIVGLGGAILIDLAVENDSDRVLGYEAVGQYVYSIASEDSKMYKHDLELYGGERSVLVDEFMRWFAKLWHWKSLAFTVASITILISFGFFFVGKHWLS